MQVISFVDILLTHTVARSVLCIVPINTIQNWMAEFNFWLPAEEEEVTFRITLTVLKIHHSRTFVSEDREIDCARYYFSC